ncbi:MAG: GFA family protein [Gammaproteobacteria bacterium]|nr:GFA family protein [Gammaproteobacteria bacterium]
MTQACGQCLCGKVKFAATGVHRDHHACHCEMCRRWTGGPAFAAEVAALELTAGQEYVRRYASSAWADRAFCSHCGANLYFYMRPTNTYYVSVGAFDDQTPFTLVGEIFVDLQPPGYAFAGELERLTEADVVAAMAGAAPPEAEA